MFIIKTTILSGVACGETILIRNEEVLKKVFVKRQKKLFSKMTTKKKNRTAEKNRSIIGS